MTGGYLLPGYRFEPPNGWTDRTIHTFVLDDGGGTGSLTVTRAAVPDGVAVRDFASAELERLSHALAGFELLDRREMAIPAGGTELMSCRWRAPNGTVDQLIAYLPSGNTLLVFTGSAPAPMPGSVRNRILAAIASVEADGTPAHG